jgi:hypothetical protein
MLGSSTVKLHKRLGVYNRESGAAAATYVEAHPHASNLEKIST